MNIRQLIQSSVSLLGEFMLFCRETITSGKRVWRRRNLFFKQCEFIGVSSTGIILVAALFLGGVLGYQLYVSFHYFGAEALLGGSVGVSLFRELAPVMAGIMVTGRAGAAMAAELSTMRITEQIDALEVMGVDPIEYLITPRVLAGTVMLPILSVFFGAIGSLAGAGVSCGLMGLSWATFWDQYTKVVDANEILHCLVKGSAFGLTLTWISCFCGFTAHGGARAVGQATRNTVVASCLCILFGDYVLTSLLPFGFARLKV